MKALYIISNGGDKLSDKEITQLEQFVQVITHEAYDVVDLAGRSKGRNSVKISSVIERAEG